MPSVVIVLDPSRLTHPDVDLRYVLPDLIAARSGGTVTADGYDYLDDGRMLVYLDTEDLGAATTLVLGVIRTEQPMRNSLASAVVAVRETPHEPYRVVQPPDHEEPLHLP